MSLLVRYHDALLGGALTTLELAAIAWVGGLVLGVLLGAVRASIANRSTQDLVSLFLVALSSIPVMVYLLWCHYPFQSMLGVSVSPFITAAAVFTLYNTLAVGEVVNATIADLPVAYSAVARVNGLSNYETLRFITIPLALRAALPSYLASQVGVLHITLFASLISVDELFRVTQRINAIEYDAVGIFSLLAIFYFILSFPLLIVARIASHKLAQSGLDR